MKTLQSIGILVLVLLTGFTIADGQESTTLQLFYPVAVDAPIAEILSGYAEDYEAANPGINVELVFSGGYTDVKTAIQTTIEGGGQPPALAVMLAADLYDVVNAGYVVSLDECVASSSEGDAFLQDFYPGFLANSYYDDQLWSVPFQRGVAILYYNVDLFADAGLDVPDSWESLAQAAQALTIRTGSEVERWGILWDSGWPYWSFQPLAIGSGQNINGATDTEVVFDDPNVVDALQYYIDLSQVYAAMPPGVQNNWAQMPSDFASGRAAMIVHSSASLRGILEQADFQVGAMAIPGRQVGTYATVVGGGNLYIMAGLSPETEDAACRFLQFLTEPERAADFAIQSSYLPVRAGAFASETYQQYLEDVPQALTIRDAILVAGAEFVVQNLGEVRTILHEYIHRAYNLELSPEDAMLAAQTEADEALLPFR